MMRNAVGLLIVWSVMSAGTGGCSKEAPERPPKPKTPSSAASQPASNVSVAPAHVATATKLIDDGLRFLMDKRDAEGGWSIEGAARPAITAMVLKALVQHRDFGPDHPVVRKGFEVLLSYQQKDGPNRGAIFSPTEGSANYTTALAVMAISAAQRPEYTESMRQAVKYLKGLQIVPGSQSPDREAIDEDHPFVGGVSYGRHGRPDLSNVGMWMEALHDAGIRGDDPAMERALAFVTRTQNRSESNPSVWAAEGTNDGGFAYAPAVRGSLSEGESKAGPAGPAGKGLRSYGSMTYVGFKSMLYADVDRKDPRVQAAFGWIRRHWRLDSNPNMPQRKSNQGLYYYYHVFSKTLRAWDQPIIADMQGDEHNWREELIDALAERVRPDGSWINQADRWYEGSPVLVTAYSVLALAEAMKP